MSRELTERQQKFLSVLFDEAGGDVVSAKKLAGYADASSTTDIVKSLVKHGADKNIKNNYGSTALQSVSGTFETVKPFYEQMNKDLGPLGLKLDFDRIEKTRPIIADLLK